MNEPLISVIIPVYNVEAYLERCLDSVINNTYKNLEIICVNDGSPDNCQIILEKYALQDSRIKLIIQENRGLSAARNTGIDFASGDYFYFLDSDDWINKNAFAVLLQAAEKSGADVIVGGFQRANSFDKFNSSNVYEISSDIEVFSADAAINKPGRMRDSVWGSLYSKDIVEGNRFPEGIKAYGEDAFFNTLIISNTDGIRYAFVDAPLYAYFNTPDSILNTMSPDKMLRSIKHWVERLDVFRYPQYAVKWIVFQLFFYRQTGKHCSNPMVAKKNIRTAIKLCRPYVWSCRKLALKQIVKMILATYTPSLYFKLLCRMDPTYLIGEKYNKIRNRNVMLTMWSSL